MNSSPVPASSSSRRQLAAPSLFAARFPAGANETTLLSHGSRFVSSGATSSSSSSILAAAAPPLPSTSHRQYGTPPPSIPPVSRVPTHRNEPLGFGPTSTPRSRQPQEQFHRIGNPLPRELDTTWMIASPLGFVNIANTCYMNSVLQMITHNTMFMPWVRKSLQLQQGRDDNAAITKEVLELANINRKYSRENILSEIKRLVGLRNSEFSGSNQADAHELLRTLLFAIHEETNRRDPVPYEELKDQPMELENETRRRWVSYHRNRDDSPVYDVFGGLICTHTRCMKCDKTSLAFDPTLDLSLAMAPSPDHGFALDELYWNYLEHELVPKRQCSFCKKTCDAEVHHVVEQLPDSLIIHLKRFNSKGLKNEADVRFVFQWTPVNSLKSFRLKSIVCHSGSLHFGHYTSYVQSLNGKWYFCNDLSVREVRADQVLENQKSVFLLSYERCNSNDAGIVSRNRAPIPSFSHNDHPSGYSSYGRSSMPLTHYGY